MVHYSQKLHLQTPLIAAAVVHAVSEALEHKVVRMHRLIQICQMEAFKSHLLSHFYIYSSHSQTLTFTNGVKMERNKKIRFQCLNPDKTNPSSRMMH